MGMRLAALLRRLGKLEMQLQILLRRERLVGFLVLGVVGLGAGAGAPPQTMYARLCCVAHSGACLAGWRRWGKDGIARAVAVRNEIRTFNEMV